MDRTLLGGQLTARRAPRVCFELATQSDDPQIRRLLRENPMPGQIALSLEREPNFFADRYLSGDQKQTIIAREAGRIVCVGSCATRMRFVNGQLCRVSYLGGLRLDKSVAGRFDILRRGYDFYRNLQTDASADACFTSIASANERARRFLERGLPGMPGYEFVGDFTTILLSTPSRRSLSTPQPFRSNDGHASLDEICEFLNHEARQYQFAPFWSVDELSALQPLGLTQDDFCVIRIAGRVVACAALWDQRVFKQTVVRGYTPWLSRLRPVVNLISRFTRRPSWPAPGTTLAHAFISHLAVSAVHPHALIELIGALFATASRRGIELLALGLAADDPRLAVVRAHFQGREYHSRIYLVRWPDITVTPLLNAACLAPEAALL